MKIFIFGDSFFDEAQNSGKTWINMLRKLYEVENFSLSGTGPHYNLPLIVNMILNKTITSDILKKSHTSSTNQQFYNNFQHEIDFAYLTFDKFLQISGHLMTGYLHSISNTKNIKVLLFGNTNNGNGKREMQVVPFEDKNFHLSKFDLFEGSDNEIFFDEVDKDKN